MSSSRTYDQHPEQDWAQFTDMPVGEVLRRTREYYGLSLEDVEKSLRIRASQLAALEEGRVDQLPGRVYAIGFVRSYAEFLGLDGDKMIHLFKAQAVGGASKPELHFPVPASESKLPHAFILIGSFIAMVGLLMLLTRTEDYEHPAPVPAPPPEITAALGVTLSGEPFGPFLPDLQPATGEDPMTTEAVAEAVPPPNAGAVQEPAPLPSASALAPEPEAISEPVPEPQPQPQPEIMAPPSQDRLIVEVISNSWVEIRDERGRVLISRVLKEGDRYIVPPDRQLIMDTGNIGGLQFIVDNEPLPVLGNRGDVMRDIRLNADILKERFMAPSRKRYNQ